MPHCAPLLPPPVWKWWCLTGATARHVLYMTLNNLHLLIVWSEDRQKYDQTSRYYLPGGAARRPSDRPGCRSLGRMAAAQVRPLHRIQLAPAPSVCPPRRQSQPQPGREVAGPAEDINGGRLVTGHKITHCSYGLAVIKMLDVILETLIEMACRKDNKKREV